MNAHNRSPKVSPLPINQLQQHLWSPGHPRQLPRRSSWIRWTEPTKGRSCGSPTGNSALFLRRSQTKHLLICFVEQGLCNAWNAQLALSYSARSCLTLDLLAWLICRSQHCMRSARISQAPRVHSQSCVAWTSIPMSPMTAVLLCHSTFAAGDVVCLQIAWSKSLIRPWRTICAQTVSATCRNASPISEKRPSSEELTISSSSKTGSLDDAVRCWHGVEEDAGLCSLQSGIDGSGPSSNSQPPIEYIEHLLMSTPMLLIYRLRLGTILTRSDSMKRQRMAVELGCSGLAEWYIIRQSWPWEYSGGTIFRSAMTSVCTPSRQNGWPRTGISCICSLHASMRFWNGSSRPQADGSCLRRPQRTSEHDLIFKSHRMPDLLCAVSKTINLHCICKLCTRRVMQSVQVVRCHDTAVDPKFYTRHTTSSLSRQVRVMASGRYAPGSASRTILQVPAMHCLSTALQSDNCHVRSHVSSLRLHFTTALRVPDSAYCATAADIMSERPEQTREPRSRERADGTRRRTSGELERRAPYAQAWKDYQASGGRTARPPKPPPAPPRSPSSGANRTEVGPMRVSTTSGPLRLSQLRTSPTSNRGWSTPCFS